MSIKNLIGENIDRVITIEACLAEGLPYGVSAKLYEKARRKFGKPLTLLAAEELISKVHEGSYVFITTGMMIPPWHTAETDGPIGAAILARAIRRELNVYPIIVTDRSELTVNVIKAACRASGLNIVKPEYLKQVTNSVSIITYPLGREEAKGKSEELTSQFNPSAIISIERLGMNIKGEYHTALGLNCSNWTAKIDYLFHIAEKNDILTIGIGDHGNEIGFGVILDEAREIVPYGKLCRCPCKSGIVSATKTSILVVAAISNWGAYGIAACIAYLKDNINLIHNGETEIYLIEECIRAGGINGATSTPILSVDAVPAKINAHIVDIMRNLIESVKMKIKRHF